jgi:DNA-binding transcriptional LysR family regulator
MDRFDAMRVFARIVERRSFTKAADDLGLPRSSVTDAVKGLELRLGVRLLQRTTRQVRPTLDGEAYYRRCVSLIADLEDAEGAFVGAKPSGLIRIDVHGTQARHFLLPGLPRFREQYPDIRLHIGEAHQPLDMIREGFDCILRAGNLADSPLIRRRLATLDRGTFASPDYLRRFGTPRTPDDLDGHEMIGLLAPDTGEIIPLVFGAGGKVRQVTLPAMVTVTGPETNVAAACLGLGLIQVPRYRVVSELATGALVEVLAEFPPSALPVHVLYSHTRQLSPRLRVFIDWMAEQFRERTAIIATAAPAGSTVPAPKR